MFGIVMIIVLDENEDGIVLLVVFDFVCQVNVYLEVICIVIDIVLVEVFGVVVGGLLVYLFQEMYEVVEDLKYWVLVMMCGYLWVLVSLLIVVYLGFKYMVGWLICFFDIVVVVCFMDGLLLLEIVFDVLIIVG